MRIGDKAKIISTDKENSDHMIKGEIGYLGRLDLKQEGKPDIIYLFNGDEVELLKNVEVEIIKTALNDLEDFL